MSNHKLLHEDTTQRRESFMPLKISVTMHYIHPQPLKLWTMFTENINHRQNILEQLLQEFLDKYISQNIMVTKTKRLRCEENVEAQTSLNSVISAGLMRKEVENAVSVVQEVCVKVRALIGHE